MIDREARLSFASVLAAYMRGEIDNFALDKEVVDVKTSNDEVLEDIRRAMWFIYDDFKCHRIHADRKRWDTLRRLIAFLKSDLERPQAFTMRPARHELRRKAIGAGALIGIIAVGYLGWRFSPFWLLLPGLVFGLPSAINIWFPNAFRKAPPASHDFYPFSDELQWRQYETLLNDSHLPEYDPTQAAVPIRKSWVSAVMTIPGNLIVVFIFMPLLWPLILIPRRSRLRMSAISRHTN